MVNDNKLGMLRKILRALGLSQQSADDVVNFILDILAGEKDNAKTTVEQLPYKQRDRFLSSAELSFYHVLRSVVQDQAIINNKVNLNDIVYVSKKDASQYRIYTNKIDRKHVDFLLCNPKTLQPILAIELDDKSHQRADRKARDEFINKVFDTVHLPLLRIPAQHTYNTNNLAAKLALYLEDIKENASDENIPLCPRCGSEMILRVAKKGANAGNQFWGCSTYPKCKGVIKITPVNI